MNCDQEIEMFVKGKPKKYCSQKCGAAYRWKTRPNPITEHACRYCGKIFNIRPDQGQKWLCSDDCRRKHNSKNVREWRQRNPDKIKKHREKRKAKGILDGNIERFQKWNPEAPSICEACGESRIIEIAHKPSYERNGAWRSRSNSKWPEMVWVLCPTCHKLIDSLNYPPEKLGLIP